MPLQRRGPHGLTQHEHMQYYQDRVAPILEELSLDVCIQQPDAPVPCMIKWLYGNARSLPISDPAVKTSLSAEVSALQADIAALEARLAKKEAVLVPRSLDEEDQLKIAGKEALLAAFPDEDEDEKAVPPKRGLQFDDNAEELEAASSAADGPAHSARGRTQTGFVAEDDISSETGGVQFDDNAEQVDAASSATDGAARSVRERAQTGFARQEDDTIDEEYEDEFDEAAGNEDEDDEPCSAGQSGLNLDAVETKDEDEDALADPTEAIERRRGPRPTAVNQTHDEISGNLGGELLAALASVPDGEEEATR